MKIVLEYHHPSMVHCCVSMWIDDVYAGELLVRQSDLATFQMVLSSGLTMRGDMFVSRGNPNPPQQREAAS